MYYLSLGFLIMISKGINYYSLVIKNVNVYFEHSALTMHMLRLTMHMLRLTMHILRLTMHMLLSCRLHTS